VIRRKGIDQQTLDKISQERAEIQKAKEQAKERLPGTYVSLKQDKEQKVFLFTGAYQKYQRPKKDWATGATIPNKTELRYRFQVYGLTIADGKANPEPKIWERGQTEADMVFLYLHEKKVDELTVMRIGGPHNQKTTYNIFPANRG
jgi:hypothetical protein